MKLCEAIKASTMYGVVKGDPKGDGEVVFKGSAKKARSMVKDLQRKGQSAYVINSPSAKVGQRAYHKKGHGLKIEVSPPDRKHQVKGIKKHMAQKKGKDKIPKTYVDKLWKAGEVAEQSPGAAMAARGAADFMSDPKAQSQLGNLIKKQLKSVGV